MISHVPSKPWFSSLDRAMECPELDIIGTFYTIALWSRFESGTNVIILMFLHHLGWDHVTCCAETTITNKIIIPTPLWIWTRLDKEVSSCQGYWFRSGRIICICSRCSFYLQSTTQYSLCISPYQNIVMLRASSVTESYTYTPQASHPYPSNVFSCHCHKDAMGVSYLKDQQMKIHLPFYLLYSFDY